MTQTDRNLGGFFQKPIPNPKFDIFVYYRTVMLRTNIKLVSFILLPIVHLLIPPFTFAVCLLRDPFQ